MKIILKKQYLFVLLCILLCLSLIYTLFIMQALNTNVKTDTNAIKEFETLKSLVEKLELKAKENSASLDELNRLYKNFLNEKNNGGANINIKQRQPSQELPKVVITSAVQQTPFEQHEKQQPVVVNDQCEWIEKEPFETDINMLSVYNELDFTDVDGGVWKQGWDVKYDESQWNANNKLHVIITPHSHNDPGWLMTFEEYFQSKTRNILDSIVNALNEKETRKFVWAETSYLSLWWAQANDDMKTKMRKIIANGQLEIVTGGWVMNDEANSHYYSMVEQMIEGHEWLRANIDPNIVPVNGWSIDPFGYAPTMAYLLKNMGFKNMLIQRVHYRIKKYLAENKKLEFYWSQLWERNEKQQISNIFTHVMPFYSYDVPHTCGPDPKICCQFDFRRMIGSDMSCPWGIQPQEITDANVHERAQTLLDQYRKKNQLYNHNVVFIPLGDDFRYQSAGEANAQYSNYEKLIKYMNSKDEWNVEAQFGTINDYFNLVRKQIKEIPTLNGDFFTYADRNDHYWSGYYTSRPLYKRLDRTVEHYLRTAELLYSFAHIHSLNPASNRKFADKYTLYKKLLQSRRYLSLFQHHDGITGTAKTAVNNDYGAKLLDSIKNSHLIAQKSLEYLLQQKLSEEFKDNIKKFDNFLLVDDTRLSHDALTTRNILSLDESEANNEKRVYVFNSNEHKRIDIITVYVNSPFIEVFDENENLYENYQVNFLWYKQQIERSFLQHEENTYELLIQVEINAFELKSFKIKYKTKSKQDQNEYQVEYESSFWTKIQFYLPNGALDSSHSDILFNGLNKKHLSRNLIQFNDLKSDSIALNASGIYQAQFEGKTGLLRELLNTKTNTKQKLNVNIRHYGVTHAREKSGAYLFLPDGPGKQLDYDVKWIRVERGRIRSRVCTHLNVLVHCIELYPLKSIILNDNTQTTPFISVWNLVDIRTTSNFELSIQIVSDIDNKDFYTDLNSFQYIRRKTFAKLPLQANVYPMPSTAYIHDKNNRLTILSAQTLGVASLEKSTIEIFLDRRLAQDDNRGLEQPILDNKLTSNRFMLIMEKFQSELTNEEHEQLAHPNLDTQLKLFDLQSPLLTILLTNGNLDDNSQVSSVNKVLYKLPTNLKIIDKNLIPCDIRVLNLRTMQTQNEQPSNLVGVIMHRLAYNCKSIELTAITGQNNYCLNSPKSSQFSFNTLFSSISKMHEIKKTYLTFLSYNNSSSTNTDDLIREDQSILELIQPMQLQAFQIIF